MGRICKGRKRLSHTCVVLHINEGHPDLPLLEHARSLIQDLEALGIKASPQEEEEGDDDGQWDDVDSEEDVDMED